MSEPQFWNVPNVQGLPTLTLTEAMQQIGMSVNAGKGAQMHRVGAPVLTIPGDGSNNDITFDELVYDELGFIVDSFPTARMVIPETDPPIRKVQAWLHCEWAANLTGAGTDVAYVSFLNTVGVGDAIQPAGILSHRFLNIPDQDEADIDVSTGHLVSRAQTFSPSTLPIIPFNVGDSLRFIVSQDSGSPADIVRTTYSLVVLE